MKKLLILLMAAGLFTACNNDKGKDPGKGQTDNRTKDDYRNTDKPTNNTTTTTDNTTTGTNNSSTTDKTGDQENKTGHDGWGDKGNEAKWSSADETKFMSDCERTATKNVGAARANEYCDCMLQKLIKLYPSYTEADRDLGTNGQDKLDKLVKECNSGH